MTLLALTGFLQVQGLRPDWHAIVHANEGGAHCSHHEEGAHDDESAPTTPEGHHTCMFTAVAAGMMPWITPIIVQSTFASHIEAIFLYDDLPISRQKVTTRQARAPPTLNA